MRPLRRRAALISGAVIAALAPVFLLAAGAAGGGAGLSLRAHPAPDGIEAVAELTDPQGRGISGAEIALLRRTTFGWLEVARLTTGTEGTVRTIMALPQAAVREIKAVAELNTETVERTLRLNPASTPPPRTRPSAAALGALSPQPGFISPYPPSRLLATLLPVLLGVWIAYGLVVYQLYRIAHNR